jgi:pyruvate dehydrogenase E2 component (dihydrolipoamide acetyltransferase)
MAFVFEFPDVGEGIHEGTVVEWLVAVGDTVAEDQPLLKVETDKAVVELPSPKPGVVLKLHAEAGELIEVGNPLVTLGAEGESLAEAPQSDEAGSAAVEVDQRAPEATAASAAMAQPASTTGLPPLATPRTRALARRLGVDLQTVAGTGPGGRITDEDVERAAAAGPEEAPAPTTPAEPAAAAPAQPAAPAAARSASPAEAEGRRETTDDGPVERVPASHLRTVIAQAMRSSKDISAHVTHVDEADVTDLAAAHAAVREKVEASWDVRFTLLPYFIKALVRVLHDHPLFNASYDADANEILYKRFYNIGVAVDTPEGLIVPVLRDADRKDMVTIAKEVSDLATRARERRLSLEELRGGTCTITNIGPLGGVLATPIIRQPELAIVGLHKIQDRPAVVDGEIAIRKLMYLSVSFDHRVIDGAQAARFMTDMVRLVSDPELLMVRS